MKKFFLSPVLFFAITGLFLLSANLPTDSTNASSTVKMAEGELDMAAAKSAFVKLYNASRTSFKDFKKGDKQTLEGTELMYFDSSLEFPGAVKSIITLDGEDSHYFEATFFPGSEDKAHSMATDLAEALFASVPQKGFALRDGTDVRFHNYKKKSIEFDSDNISMMGRYPSASIGVIKDGDHFIVELRILEPFWK